MKKFTARELAFGAILAGVYGVLTIVLPIPQYGGIQVRLAEALTVLPFFFPQATWGLTLGCFLANLFSPVPLDMIFGTLATLIACLLTQRMPSLYLAWLPPVVCNAVIVGGEIAWMTAGFTPAFWPNYGLFAFTVGLGELLACGVLGTLLLKVLPKIPSVGQNIPPQKLKRKLDPPVAS